MFCDFFRWTVLFSMVCWASFVQSGILLNTRRVIYQGNDIEARGSVQNRGGGEILLHSWRESPGGAGSS
ncbi:molecular chaperone, partial [Pseudomonas syringae pv. tagetis]